ncbi:MAG: leucine-rich repeat protein, partial [Eubacterium sp.]
MKKALSLLLSVVMLLSITAGLDLTTYAETLTGSCGENVTYTLDTETGVLTISGTGPMNDYWFSFDEYGSSSNVPWYNNSSSVKTVEIEYGVTRIGNCAFSPCYGLTSITIPDGVTSIGERAFYS